MCRCDSAGFSNFLGFSINHFIYRYFLTCFICIFHYILVVICIVPFVFLQGCWLPRIPVYGFHHSQSVLHAFMSSCSWPSRVDNQRMPCAVRDRRNFFLSWWIKEKLIVGSTRPGLKSTIILVYSFNLLFCCFFTGSSNWILRIYCYLKCFFT